jgi:alpha-L-rhamnosidase
MAFTLDSTLGDILEDPQAVKVLDQYVPGASQHPMLAMAKGMSLRMIVSMPQAAQLGLTQDKAQAMLDQINKGAIAA